MTTQTATTRKFWLVYGIGTDFVYEVHAYNCRAKRRNAWEPGDIVLTVGADAQDVVSELKADHRADWECEPANSNYKIHDCAKRSR